MARRLLLTEEVETGTVTIDFVHDSIDILRNPSGSYNADGKVLGQRMESRMTSKLREIRRDFRRLARLGCANLFLPERPPTSSQTVREWLSTAAGAEASLCPVAPAEPARRNIVDIVEPGGGPPGKTVGPDMLPESYVLTIPEGRVVGRDGVIVTPDDVILSDLSLDFMAYSRRVGKQRLTCSGNIPRATYQPTRIAVLSSQCYRNYSHYLFQILPRLDVLNRSGVEVDHYVLHLDRSYHRQLAELTGIDLAKVISPGRFAHIRAKTLVVPSVTQHNWLTTSGVEFLRSMRDRLPLSNLPDSATLPSRIYISRAKTRTRRLANEKEFVSLLEKRRFARVFLEDLTVGQQIQLLGNAEFVIGQHGAGMANLIFCNPGTRVIEIFSPELIDVAFAFLSCQADLDYEAYVGQMADWRSRCLKVHSRGMYRISADMIDDAIHSHNSLAREDKSAEPGMRRRLAS